MRIVKSIALAAVLSAVAGGAFAADEEALVKYRQATMEVVGGHMHGIVPALKGEVPFKEYIAAHAKGIADIADISKAAFKDKAMAGKTTATEDIWANWEKFAGGMDMMKEKATVLAQAADAGDMGAIGAAVQDLGKTCKGCHDNFRKKD